MYKSYLLESLKQFWVKVNIQFHSLQHVFSNSLKKCNILNYLKDNQVLGLLIILIFKIRVS